MLVPGCFIIVYYVLFFFEERDQRLNVGFTLFSLAEVGSPLLGSVASCMCVYSLMQSISYLV